MSLAPSIFLLKTLPRCAMWTATTRGAGRPRSISAVSLNVGGRSTNPLEFLLDGDETAGGLRAGELRRRAENAMVDA